MTERSAQGCYKKLYKFLHTVIVERPMFFCTLTCLKGPHTGVAERPKFLSGSKTLKNTGFIGGSCQKALSKKKSSFLPGLQGPTNFFRPNHSLGVNDNLSKKFWHWKICIIFNVNHISHLNYIGEQVVYWLSDGSSDFRGLNWQWF